MDPIEKALDLVVKRMSEWEPLAPIPFEEFLKVLTSQPDRVLRNAFQIFHDLVKSHVSEGMDEYPNDPESIHYMHYNCSKLFVEGTDNPFFADRLFANRLVSLVESLKRGAQQNKIYIFEGPPGSGKSTFLNNLLLKFERYANTAEGRRHEVVWRLSRKNLASIPARNADHFLDKLSHLLDEYEFGQNELIETKEAMYAAEDYVEVPCPSHDNPILMIPKSLRREFFEQLFRDDPANLERLLTEKEFEWVFRGTPCTICRSLYLALLEKVGNPLDVYRMIFARPYQFSRSLGEGISVFTPGDKPVKQNILTNDILQNRINTLLRDSNKVKYLFSRYAKTNNGIYALMDIKSHNTERLIELHNIISEGLHKVEDTEENVNSLFIALMNPEDKQNIQGFQSFLDRIEYIKVPYVLDLNTEVEIYRNTFGTHIDNSFLPRVLHNFARVIISTRLKSHSAAMSEWIQHPVKYRHYCDDNLMLLKMEIYTGNIPKWLDDEDVKRLNAKRRRNIIAESEMEGDKGLSGRDSLKIFNDFFSTYARKDKLIDMSILVKYFTKVRTDLAPVVAESILDSLTRMYNYTVLQEVKESLYSYNEEQISRDIQNYLFAVNFKLGSKEVCKFTGEKLEITEELLAGIESRLLGPGASSDSRHLFRRDVQKEYTVKALTQEMMLEGRKITETSLYQTLRERYIHNLKERVLDPFLENENFRRAIKDFGREDFKTYDQRIRDDVTFLVTNLCSRYQYTRHGAKEVCIYVIDNDIARQFAA